MKVLLFVQTGDARPKCVKSFGDRRHNAMNYFNAIRPKFGTSGQPDSGWLVECENADAGRAIITHDFLLRTSVGKAFAEVGPVVRSRDPNKLSERVNGRILASGAR